MVPACLAKSRLTIPGNNTPMMPMLAPAIRLPANSPTSPNALRSRIPAANVSRIPSTTRSALKRRARIGASGANRPRHSTGNVVSKPALAADNPRLLETSLSSGDRLDSAGRRFSATSTRPSINSHGRLTSGWLCWTPSSSASASISSCSNSGVRLASGFIDQLPAEGFGALRVLLRDGIKQRGVQVEHCLAARRDVQGLAQLRADDAGKVLVQLAQRRVVRRVHQLLVEYQISADVGLQLPVIQRGAGAERRAQPVQVLLGATQGGQADGLHFQDLPRFLRLFQAAMGQRAHRAQRVRH